jgi:hypothetical protein
MEVEQKIVTKIQPNVKNLWIVTREPISGNYINYTVESANNSKTSSSARRNFHDIIVDIDTFLKQAKDRSFRFFH